MEVAETVADTEEVAEEDYKFLCFEDKEQVEEEED